MKLILTSDVLGLGAPGDVVEVKDGYGRNYLLPRGLAAPWTKGGEKQVVQIKRARSSREVRDLDHAKEIKAALEAKPVRLVSKAGGGGRLFGSIGGADVADAVTAAADRPWTSARSPCPRRSSPWARTPPPSRCTRRSRPRSPSRWSPPAEPRADAEERAPGQSGGPLLGSVEGPCPHSASRSVC